MLSLNDKLMRNAIHNKILRRQHQSSNTLIVDELGLKHGKNIADIAVINGHFYGIEIKSDEDSLMRLPQQIQSYNDIFDKVRIFVGIKHIDEVQNMIPEWWGITLTQSGVRGGISFETIQFARHNHNTDSLSVAQLLWKSEASNILAKMNLPPKVLRQNRLELYRLLTELLSPIELRRQVRNSLRTRKDWRDHLQPSLNDDSPLPSPM